MGPTEGGQVLDYLCNHRLRLAQFGPARPGPSLASSPVGSVPPPPLPPPSKPSAPGVRPPGAFDLCQRAPAWDLPGAGGAKSKASRAPDSA